MQTVLQSCPVHSLIGKVTVSPIPLGVHLRTQFHIGSTDIPQVGLPSSPFMTRRETAAFLKVSEKWLAQSGRAIGPDFHKFGNHCRYHVDDVVQWARQQQVRR